MKNESLVRNWIEFADMDAKLKYLTQFTMPAQILPPTV